MAEKVKPQFPVALLWMLDNKVREKYGNHKSLLLKLGISRGMHVLEPGCGPGILTQSISSIVGETGWIFAFDMNSKMIERAKQRLSTVKTVSLAVCTASQVPIAVQNPISMPLFFLLCFA
jgi:ubiquinone/menaquinone biosynthesis C-methylase UbiE